MTIEKLDPPALVIWKCHGDKVGTTLSWEIEPADGGSRLRFTQSGWKSMTGMVATSNSTWGELMYRLKAYAEIPGRIGGNNARPPPLRFVSATIKQSGQYRSTPLRTTA